MQNVDKLAQLIIAWFLEYCCCVESKDRRVLSWGLTSLIQDPEG